MPDAVPAAEAFYDVRDDVRRHLRRIHIRKCLDELGAFRNVVFLPGVEFTGPKEFADFWIDTVHDGKQKPVVGFCLASGRRKTSAMRCWTA